MESPYASPKTTCHATSPKSGSPAQAIACFWGAILSTALCYLCAAVFWHLVDGPYYLPPTPWFVTALGWMVPLLATTTQVIGVIYWRTIRKLPSETRWYEVALWVGAAMVVSAIPLALCLFGLTMTLLSMFTPTEGPVITAG